MYNFHKVLNVKYRIFSGILNIFTERANVHFKSEIGPLQFST